MITTTTPMACLLCSSAAKSDSSVSFGFSHVKCCQCGDFCMENPVAEILSNKKNTLDTQKLSAVITEWNLQENPRLTVTYTDKDKCSLNGKTVFMSYSHLLEKFPKTQSELYDRVLMNLYHLEARQKLSHLTFFDKFIPSSFFFAVGTTPVDILNTLFTTITSMVQLGFIAMDLRQLKSFRRLAASRIPMRISITEGGYDRIDQVLNNEARLDPVNVFIAMWRDESRDEFFTQGVLPAIRDAYYPYCESTPVYFDYGPHNETSSGAIPSAIKSCNYMIADITGNKNWVYQEAGYAQALEIPVIWIFDKVYTQLSNVETRLIPNTHRYDFLIYRTPEELYGKLKERILETVPIEVLSSEPYF